MGGRNLQSKLWIQYIFYLNIYYIADVYNFNRSTNNI
jgi:hypothetical protein